MQGDCIYDFALHKKKTNKVHISGNAVIS